jgi:glycosyltransferase involved in cell wall biosynthesis
MPKIGLYLDGEPAGGALQHDLTMLRAFGALREAGYEVVVGCGSDRWIEYLPDCDLPLVRMTPSRTARFTSKAWRSARLPMRIWRALTPHFDTPARAMLSQRCDLWVFSNQAAWSFQSPVRSLVTIHDLMHRYERRFPEVGGEYEFREQLFGNICAWASGVLVDSVIGKQQVIESYGIAPERVFALPYIAPAHVFNRTVPADFEARCPLPQKFIFYPAQFWAHKNHANLVRALAPCRERGTQDIQLVLIGSQQNGYTALRELIEQLGVRAQVHFLGYVQNEYMAEIYRRARAMMMPTFFGPTNIPPLEAFALGCPCAVSGIYGMPEQAGGAALLFDPNSVEQIADAMQRLWADDAVCADLRERGLARAAQWTQAHFDARLREIIETVLMH